MTSPQLPCAARRRPLRQLALAAALAGLAGAASAGPLWVSMGEDAWALLRTMGPDVSARVSGVEHRALTVQRLDARSGALVQQAQRVVIARVDEALLLKLSNEVHDKLHRCGGYIVHASRTQARQSVARMATHASGRLAERATVPSYALDDAAAVNALLPQVQESQLLSGIQQLTSYQNRYYNSSHGVQASNDLAARWRTYAAGRTDVRVEQVSHAGWPQKSVVMTIRGTEAPGEILLMGGHLDSITPMIARDNGRSPGADDDASGIATVQEVARVLLQSTWRPKRTIQFMAYAAEEVGLRGSADIAERYRVKGRNVVGALQLDMTNYPGAASDITLITDFTNAAQNEFLGRLAAQYLPELRVNTSACGYACSDHASWTNAGYAASFPFEAPLGEDNPHIHTKGDTLDKSGNSANHAVKFARLALAWAVELGSDAGPAAATATARGGR